MLRHDTFTDEFREGLIPESGQTPQAAITVKDDTVQDMFSAENGF